MTYIGTGNFHPCWLEATFVHHTSIKECSGRKKTKIIDKFCSFAFVRVRSIEDLFSLTHVNYLRIKIFFPFLFVYIRVNEFCWTSRFELEKGRRRRKKENVDEVAIRAQVTKPLKKKLDERRRRNCFLSSRFARSIGASSDKHQRSVCC